MKTTHDNSQNKIQSAVHDDALSFYRYLAVSDRDRNWGLFLTGTGHEVMTLTTRTSDQSRASYSIDCSNDDMTIKFAANYPKSRQYQWKNGKKMADEYGLLYVSSGVPWVLETEATDEKLHVAPGSIILLFPGVWHRYRPMFSENDSFSSTHWCLFGGEIARNWQARKLFSPRRPVLNVGDDPSLEICFRRLRGFVQSDETIGLQQSLAGTIVELLGKAQAYDGIKVGPKLSSDVLQKARAILEDMTSANIRLERVARILNLPYGQFRRSFKMATGLSPHQYRMQAVIRQAKEFLQTSDLSITEIATVLHFSDPYYFAKAFKRVTGSTPTEWRYSVKTPVANERPNNSYAKINVRQIRK